MRGHCPKGIEKMTSLRVSNVDPSTSVDRYCNDIITL